MIKKSHLVTRLVSVQDRPPAKQSRRFDKPCKIACRFEEEGCSGLNRRFIPGFELTDALERDRLLSLRHAEHNLMLSFAKFR